MTGTIQELTPPGRGAVAALRLNANLMAVTEAGRQADRSLFSGNRYPTLADLPLNRLCYGNWNTEGLVVCRIAEDVVEIYPHGGLATVQQIVQDLAACGVQNRPMESSDFHSIYEQDVLKVLTECLTTRTASYVLQQRNQARSFWQRCQNGDLSASELETANKWKEFGRHLIEPWSLVLTGLPNVGKSSMMNRILGYERSIVYDQPGTTRDLLETETALDGWPIRLCDTAGQRDQSSGVEAAGIDLARQKLQEADLIVLLVDRSIPLDEATIKLMETYPSAILVYHKSDLPVDHSWSGFVPKQECCAVSSKTQAGMNDLMSEIVARLIPDLPTAEMVYPISPLQREWLRMRQ